MLGSDLCSQDGWCACKSHIWWLCWLQWKRNEALQASLNLLKEVQAVVQIPKQIDAAVNQKVRSCYEPVEGPHSAQLLNSAFTAPKVLSSHQGMYAQASFHVRVV